MEEHAFIVLRSLMLRLLTPTFLKYHGRICLYGAYLPCWCLQASLVLSAFVAPFPFGAYLPLWVLMLLYVGGGRDSGLVCIHPGSKAAKAAAAFIHHH
jgi:hypothetical protein